jgi:ATP-dependent DNA helicase RecG
LKARTRIANSEYQALVRVARATATRDLDGLLIKGVLEKVGTTGKGTYYVLAKKRLTKASKES